MNNFKTGQFFRKYAALKCGATGIEYALIAAGISITIAVVAVTLGTKVAGLFTTVSNAIN